MAREYKFGRRVLKLDLRAEADESVFREIFLDRDYMVVDDIIKGASSAVLDIGAHIGLFSMYVRCLNDNVKIFAYEPDSENFAAMKKHFAENHIRDIFPKNTAVAAKDGETVLFLSEDSHNHSIFNFFEKETKHVKVPAVSMNKIFERDFARQGVDFCDLVKMDCEGAEFEILVSMGPDLFKKTGAFYIEYHEYSEGKKKEDLVKILQKHGFKTRVSGSRHDERFGYIFACK